VKVIDFPVKEYCHLGLTEGRREILGAGTEGVKHVADSKQRLLCVQQITRQTTVSEKLPYQPVGKTPKICLVTFLKADESITMTGVLRGWTIGVLFVQQTGMFSMHQHPHFQLTCYLVSTRGSFYGNM
jgi:hypothetical protein